MNQDKNIDCPCCRYVSLVSGEHGEICPICFWEYDSFIKEQDPASPSVSNHGLTLEQARENFEIFGACEEDMVQHVIPAEARKFYKRIYTY